MQALADLTTTDFAAAGSPDGRAWIAALPSISGRLARQWSLTFTGEPFRHGYNAVVLLVTQGSRPLALKLTWPPGRAQSEADALAAWRARGAAELVACDAPRGALLLEHLDASRSLGSIPPAEAAATAGALIRTLAIEAPQPFPSLQAAARQLAATFPARQRSLRGPVPHQWITLAARLAAGLALDPGRCLVHTDLHYDNILASGRVDELPGPQAITGLLSTLVENGQLDPAKATAWGFVRSIDYWLWGLENGLTIAPLDASELPARWRPWPSTATCPETGQIH
jgi:hypothetical protein